jgi:hypothetical protein
MDSMELRKKQAYIKAILFMLVDGSYERWLLNHQNWRHEDLE